MKFLPIHICSVMLLASFAAQAETRISVTGDQAELCDVDGIKTLHSGNGYSVESFATRNTTPSIVVSLNGRECYFDLVAGEGTGFNVKYNGVTYHTQRPRYVPTFFFKPATDATTYSFKISAAGQFDIDWGDGTIQMIDKTDTADTVYTHNYARAANTYDISLGGRATAYNTGYVAAIAFAGPEGNDAKTGMELKEISGCLGCIFGTLDAGGDGNQPKFYRTFLGSNNLTGPIPPNLFKGLSGKPVGYMFWRTFQDCTGLNGAIPAGLFSDLYGAPGRAMFFNTFIRTSITEIPENLFDGIVGTATGAFDSTFEGCTKLTNIPAGLFSGITGIPTSSVFAETFSGCTSLTAIPAGLFDGLDTSADYPDNLFYQTFRNCTNLTGDQIKINDKYIWQIWPDATEQHTYYNDTGLTDYSQIPDEWK